MTAVCRMAFSSASVVRELLQHPDLAVEVDHFDHVFAPQLAREPDGGFLSRGEAFLHARASVEQDRERNRLLHLREERQRLLRAVLVHLEVGLVEIGHVTRAVHDRDVERHELDAALEPLLGDARDREADSCR